ncbi:hypothetical protein [Sphingomonas sp.]|uniref:hypothetical protein n=1 Tax=Sphingomonas TaxID=13687 RepID=UPI000964BFF5|nr:hypothetical protein [Sphingomonas sp.]MBN8812418.1 hypothetical protein [Sphingomonas sp.]OJY49020.1 MAG: hypothetical protein BGP17_10555 [Sphingomonas sp. 67-41]
MSGRGPIACCAAILAAALAGSIGFMLLAGSLAGDLFLLCFFIALILAFGHLVFIALPIYLVLVDRWPLRMWNAGLAGFLIGAIPMSLLGLGGRPDLEALLSAILWFGGSGLVGGLAFCAVRGGDIVVPDGAE